MYTAILIRYMLNLLKKVLDLNPWIIISAFKKPAIYFLAKFYIWLNLEISLLSSSALKCRDKYMKIPF